MAILKNLNVLKALLYVLITDAENCVLYLRHESAAALIVSIQIGVYPLMSKDGLLEKTCEIQKLLTDDGFIVELDETGSIGRRYARADEAGIQLGITVDYDTLQDNTITIRDRDSWKQVRTPIQKLPDLLHRYFTEKIEFEDLGTLLETHS